MKQLRMLLFLSLMMSPIYVRATDTISDLLAPTAQKSVGDEHCDDNDATETESKHVSDIMALFFDILQHPTNIKLVTHNITHIFSDMIHMILHLLDQEELNQEQAAQEEVSQEKIKKSLYRENLNACIANFDEQTAEKIARSLSQQIITQQKKSFETKEGSENEEDEGKMVLNNFAGIVGSFSNILKDPDNKNNLVHNITNIFGHVLHVAMHMKK